MHVLIVIVGILQAVGGVLFFLIAKSEIHEILGSLTFGFGILSLALGTALSRLDEIKAVSQQSSALQGKIAQAFDRLGH
jgi:Na+/phosphate symporter